MWLFKIFELQKGINAIKEFRSEQLLSLKKRFCTRGTFIIIRFSQNPYPLS